ncbi:hypothetical protein Angca_006435, partial [Angiostrongylus cantonensis]
VMQCASEGIASTGVELNGILVAYSKYRAARAGLSSKARFRRIDIFKTDLERFNTALIFGAENMMGDLLPKLSEMRSGASLLCCRFPLPECDHFKPIAQIGDGIDAVYFYYYVTYTPEDFDKYLKETKALVRERQRYGTNLWIPFYSTKKTPEK